MSTETERPAPRLREDADASLASAMLPVFERMAPPPPTDPARRALRLLGEGVFYTALGLVVAGIMDFPQSGFIALFLSAAGLTGRLSEILDDNRHAIYERHASSLSANRITIIHLLSLFTGAFLAFSIAALWYGEAGLRASFGFILDTTHLGRDTLLTRRFGGALPLFTHNAAVLAFFVAISFIYRAYGALLVLCWNACTWGLALTLLARRGLSSSEAHPIAFVMLALLAMLPHLILEASAYVIGSIAAIFFSRAFAKYELGSPILRSVLRAVGRLLAVSVACLGLAAIVESWLPGVILSWLPGA